MISEWRLSSHILCCAIRMHKHSPQLSGRGDFRASPEALRANLKPSLARAFAATATGNHSLANVPRS